MNEFLLFTLYSPMSSWGEIAVGEIRSSKTHPGRSAVLGIVAASLGIRRTDSEKLHNLHDCLSLGVKVISSGNLVNDFHTVQAARTQKSTPFRKRADELNAGSDMIGTIVSTREYRSDALYIVALWQNSVNAVYTLQEILDSLNEPVFAPYLGRKSCPPACKFVPQIVVSETLKDAFNQYGVKPLWFGNTNPNNDGKYERKVFNADTELYYWDECENSGLDRLLVVERYDKVLDPTRRLFRTRQETMTLIRKGDV